MDILQEIFQEYTAGTNSAAIHHADELTDLAEWYVTGRLPHGLNM